MRTSRFLPMLFGIVFSAASVPGLADLVQTVAKVKPSVVGVGTYQPTRTPQGAFNGTGFVIDDGTLVVTNAHVLPAVLEAADKERLVVLSGDGRRPTVHAVKVVALDREHDIALLRLQGSKLPALSLGDSDQLKEGARVAFTGYPLGMLLGLYPATHQGIVAGITPYVIPAQNANQLNVKAIRGLDKPFNVFQLDAIAYPGNSGSPLYDPESGVVYGVLNSVFIKETKENLLKQPSGITYVIPSNYIRALMKQAQ